MAAIPIYLTDAEARAQLEQEHAITYEPSILGKHVRARCTCGWVSEWEVASWNAEESAFHHRRGHITVALEKRARYAIFWRRCGACDGSGRFETRDGVDQGECAHCVGGGLWAILDRTGEHRERYGVSQGKAMELLWDDLKWETGR